MHAGVTAVFLTIDTELMWRHHTAGCDLATQAARSLEPAGVGIAYQLETLARHGLKATFFVDPMPTMVFGLDAIRPVVEAIVAFGATPTQKLVRVQIPLALPTIMAGINQTTMMALSMVVIAALIGANGLGKPVVRALNPINIPLGIEAGLAIVVIAIVLDRICRIGEAK